MYYDRKGAPMGFGDWVVAFEDPHKRRIAETNLPNGVVVSTIWLGLEHGRGEDGLPLIFETAVFDSGVMVLCKRTSTEKEAKETHGQTVKAKMGEKAKWSDAPRKEE